MISMSGGSESSSSPDSPSSSLLGNEDHAPRQVGEKLGQRNDDAPESRHLSSLHDEVGSNAKRMVSESPEFVADLIQRMNMTIDSMNENEKSAYVEACQRSPQIATDTEFRLKFLRAELFDPGLAAHRLTQYFEFTRQWFGSDRLKQIIYQSDLDGDDHESLLSGGLQLLSEKDGAGRSILFFRMSDCTYKSIINMVRGGPFGW